MYIDFENPEQWYNIPAITNPEAFQILETLSYE